MNILVSGGAGFIGSRLCLKLKRLGYKVRVLDSLISQVHGERPLETSFLFRSMRDHVDFHFGCVTSKKSWIEALKDQDAVIHLASETGTSQSMTEIIRYANANIIGFANLLDSIATLPNGQIKKLILSSSRAVYGEGKYYNKFGNCIYPKPRKKQDLVNGIFDLVSGGERLLIAKTDESSPLMPASVYGTTKVTQEQLLENLCEKLNVQSTIFRFQNVYGPGQSLLNSNTGMIPYFYNRISKGLDIELFEDGKQIRDFIYVDDAVDAIISSLSSSICENNVYNVGSGVGISLEELVTHLIGLSSDSQSKILTKGYFRLGDIRHNIAEIGKIKSDFQFSPKVNFMQGLERFYEWAKNNKNIYEC